MDPALRAKQAEIYEALMGLYRGAIETLAAAGELAPEADREREALRLAALVDGLALHVTMREAEIGADEVLAVLRRHLDSVGGG